MALSLNDFTSATTPVTAYPCGDKKKCQALLKEVPELNNVKMVASVRDTLKKGSKPGLSTKEKLNVR